MMLNHKEVMQDDLVRHAKVVHDLVTQAYMTGKTKGCKQEQERCLKTIAEVFSRCTSPAIQHIHKVIVRRITGGA